MILRAHLTSNLTFLVKIRSFLARQRSTQMLGSQLPSGSVQAMPKRSLPDAACGSASVEPAFQCRRTDLSPAPSSALSSTQPRLRLRKKSAPACLANACQVAEAAKVAIPTIIRRAAKTARMRAARAAASSTAQADALTARRAAAALSPQRRQRNWRRYEPHAQLCQTQKRLSDSPLAEVRIA